MFHTLNISNKEMLIVLGWVKCRGQMSLCVLLCMYVWQVKRELAFCITQSKLEKTCYDEIYPQDVSAVRLRRDSRVYWAERQTDNMTYYWKGGRGGRPRGWGGRGWHLPGSTLGCLHGALHPGRHITHTSHTLSSNRAMWIIIGRCYADAVLSKCTVTYTHVQYITLCDVIKYS